MVEEKMRTKLKTRRKNLVSALIVLFILSMVATTYANSEIPHQFWGSVTIGGVSAPDGTLVEAKIAGIMYAFEYTVDGTYGYPFEDSFYVPADDPYTTEVEGGVDGDTVQFYVDGIWAVDHAFESGQGTELDLFILSSVDLTVTVVEGSPVAVASATTNYLTVTFDGTKSSDPEGTIVSYSWDFGDKTPLGTGSNPSHSYSVSGTYTVTLTVTDNDGLTDSCDLTLIVTRRRIIILRNVNPNANAGRNRRVHVGEFVDFSGVNSTDPDGRILSYEWDFGDGAEASGVNVSHRYLMADNYTVTLTVVDNRYGEDTDTCMITVIEEIIIPPPLPPYLDNLKITPAELELGDSVTISFDIRNFDSQHITYGVDIYVEDVNITRIWIDLGGYEFKTVSHTITPDTVGIYSVAVHGMTGSFTVEPEAEPEPEPEPAEFVVSGLIITPEEVEPGDEVTISVLVTNVGEQGGTHTVVLGVDDSINEWIASETVSLEGGESERVEFEVSRDIEGTYQVEVDGLTGSFVVSAPLIPPTPAEFVFSDLRIFYPGVIPPEVERGETVTVAVSIEAENVGELMGSHTVELKVNESVVDSQELTLEGGASETVLFELTRGEGTYQVEVEDLTETFIVSEIPIIPFWMRPGYAAGIFIVIVSTGAIIYLLGKGRFPSIYSPHT